MDKFEYKKITYNPIFLSEKLSELGDKGWELVDIQNEYYSAIFKRRKEKILCDVTTKIVSTNTDRFGSYAHQCKELISNEYELIDIIRNENGDYYAHLGKYEYK